MKWYNKEKTKMLNLNFVNGYIYVDAEKYINEYPDSEESKEFKEKGDRIDIILGETPYVFRGLDAKELVLKLQNLYDFGDITEKKEILQG
jgi:hypothetical protein